MHYSEGAFWRPLFETDMEILQVASGCSHNRCKFCAMYRQRFTPSPMEEILADLDEIAAWRPGTRRLFLGGGNAFHLGADRLLEVAAAARKRLPALESLGCFARIEDVSPKTDDELARLADAGFSMVSIGAESGLDEALACMDKGHTSADVVQECSRLDAAGISYALFLLLGIAGEGRGHENARASARVFGQVNPKIVMVHTMSPFEGTRLRGEIDRGEFRQEPEVEILRELREFCAAYEKPVRVLANHYANVAPFDAMIPANRERVIAYLDACIAEADEAELARFRRGIKSI